MYISILQTHPGSAQPAGRLQRLTRSLKQSDKELQVNILILQRGVPLVMNTKDRSYDNRIRLVKTSSTMAITEMKQKC